MLKEIDIEEREKILIEEQLKQLAEKLSAVNASLKESLNVRDQYNKLISRTEKDLHKLFSSTETANFILESGLKGIN